MGEVPDFDQLARETLWTAETWRWAWDSLEPLGERRPALWRNFMKFVQTGADDPRTAASMLMKALITSAAQPAPSGAAAGSAGE